MKKILIKRSDLGKFCQYIAVLVRASQNSSLRSPGHRLNLFQTSFAIGGLDKILARISLSLHVNLLHTVQLITVIMIIISVFTITKTLKCKHRYTQDVKQNTVY